MHKFTINAAFCKYFNFSQEILCYHFLIFLLLVCKKNVLSCWLHEVRNGSSYISLKIFQMLNHSLFLSRFRGMLTKKLFFPGDREGGTPFLFTESVEPCQQHFICSSLEEHTKLIQGQTLNCVGVCFDQETEKHGVAMNELSRSCWNWLRNPVLVIVRYTVLTQSIF